MSSIKRFSQFLNEEEEWIQDAIKKPGLLRRHFHKKEGEKMSLLAISLILSIYGI